MKQRPIGICDLCGERIPADLGYYTSKGKPRQYCSIDCRNTGNSREGADVRSWKARKRVTLGLWVNPSPLLNDVSPEEVRRWQEKVSLGLSRRRKREVAEGTWHNPALSEQARQKLSRPRKHGDNPTLHSAIEKLSQGCKVADLTTEEAEAYRQYRRELVAARREEINAWYRKRYQMRQASLTPEEREAQRAKWREQNQRKSEKRA